MREILFRGKTKFGYWEYGFYIKGNGGHFIEQWDSFRQEMTYTPVIPETVGQYTGLKDMSGKKIFEGDCVFMPDWESGGIIYFDSAWMFRYDDNSGARLLKRIHKMCGITGNIHDNEGVI